MKHILFFGPLAPPYTGQSIAFTTVVNRFKNEKSTIINISGKNTISSGLLLCLKIIFVVLFGRIDLIYFTCSRSFNGSVRDVVLLICARIRRIPVINHLHGSDFKVFYDSLPSWYRRIVRWCYNGVGESVVLIDGMKAEFADFSKMKLTVIPNSYSSNLDSCPTNKVRNSGQPIEVLYLSNIMKTKGILHLLNAIEVIFSKYDNINLSIAGLPIGEPDCPESEITQLFNEQYERISKDYPGRINYLGVVSGENKKQLLWKSDVFVLPTYYPTEAFPLSILEALRTGNYIITTNHRFIPSIVSDDNGSLVEPDSTIALFEALDEIAEHPERIETTQDLNIWYAMDHYQEKEYLSALEQVLAGKN